MSNEEKKGKYEQFDAHEASWVCPNCKKDALKVEDHYRYHGKLKTFYTFFCVNCQLDSNYYGVYVKEKESFNAVYRQFSKELEWARWLLQKGRDEGVIACNKRHAELKEIQDEFSTRLDCFKMGK